MKLCVYLLDGVYHFFKVEFLDDADEIIEEIEKEKRPLCNWGRVDVENEEKITSESIDIGKRRSTDEYVCITEIIFVLGAKPVRYSKSKDSNNM